MPQVLQEVWLLRGCADLWRHEDFWKHEDLYGCRRLGSSVEREPDRPSGEQPPRLPPHTQNSPPLFLVCLRRFRWREELEFDDPDWFCHWLFLHQWREEGSVEGFFPGDKTVDEPDWLVTGVTDSSKKKECSLLSSFTAMLNRSHIPNIFISPGSQVNSLIMFCMTTYTFQVLLALVNVSK